MVAGARTMMWANFRRGPSLAVPAPVDDKSSSVWWYDRIAQLAEGWAGHGITDILFPSPCKTQSGSFRTGDGYGLFDHYDLGNKNQMGGVPTRFGTAEQLRRAIAICRANGMAVHLDLVMHQCAGGRNGVYRYLGADAKTLNGRFPKDPGCFRGAASQGRVPEDPVISPPDDFAFGDELSPVNATPPHYVWNGLLDWGDWLFHTLGAQGARVDDTKGEAASFLNAWASHGAMAEKFLFAEHASGNRDDLTWFMGQMNRPWSCIDFDFHYNMAQRMCMDAGSGRFFMGSLAHRGLIGNSPMHAVPFVESMDSDTNGFATIVFNKILAYALMLGGEGLPMIYARDYLRDPDCYGLEGAINNLTWCHQMLASGPTVPRWGDQTVFVAERTGAPGLLMALNNDVWDAGWKTVTVQTGFGAHVHLHDYTGHNEQDCWTDGQGRATFGIPPGADGRGYGMWSRAGLSAAIKPASFATEQVFFGAPDLDTGPATVAGTVVGRVWCAPATDLRLSLAKPPDVVGRPTVDVRAPSGALIRLTGDSVDIEERGWHQLIVSAPAGEAPMNVALTARYWATRDLHASEL